MKRLMNDLATTTTTAKKMHIILKFYWFLVLHSNKIGFDTDYFNCFDTENLFEQLMDIFRL